MRSSADGSPRLSVVMPVHNGERFLTEAIDSVLQQTYQDFEFIIVDDGSTDNTPKILREYQQRDPRIIVLHQPDNLGIVASLNQGFQRARGEFIARVDADDVNFPERFAVQMKTFDENPNLAVLGSAAHIINHLGDVSGEFVSPVESGVIRWMMIATNCIIHSSVMIRKEIAAKYNFYTPEFLYAQDYELWSRISLTEMVLNLPIPLIKLRIWGGSVTGKKRSQQNAFADRVSLGLMRHYVGEEVTKSAALALRNLKDPRFGVRPENIHQVRETRQLLTKLYCAYSRSISLTNSENKAISYDIAVSFYRLAFIALRYSVWEGLAIAVSEFLRSPRSTLRIVQTVGGRKLLRQHTPTLQ